MTDWSTPYCQSGWMDGCCRCWSLRHRRHVARRDDQPGSLPLARCRRAGGVECTAKRLMDDVTIEGGASLLQWLGAPGFDGERHVTRGSPTGALQLLLKSATLRAGEGGLFKMVAVTDVTALLAAQQRID